MSRRAILSLALWTLIAGGFVGCTTMSKPGSSTTLPSSAFFPSQSGGPTCPFAPAIPGIWWQTGQPARTNNSWIGSSPVTNGTMLESIFGTCRSGSEDGKPFRIPANATSNTNPAANVPKALFFWFVRGTDGGEAKSGIDD